MLKIRYKSNLTECKYIMYQIIVNQSFIHIVATIKTVPVIAETKTGNHKNTISRKRYEIQFAANCIISIVI